MDSFNLVFYILKMSISSIEHFHGPQKHVAIEQSKQKNRAKISCNVHDPYPNNVVVLKKVCKITLK